MWCPLIGGFCGGLVAGAGVPVLNHLTISFLQSLFEWNGWWFVLFVFALTIAAIWVANDWQKQQEFRLQQVRSRIATDLHDDIGSSLSQVAIMCEVLSRQSLTERETLQEIAGVSRGVLTSMSEIVWAVDPRHDHLRDLTQRMRWFAGETLSGLGVALDFIAAGPSSEVRLEAETRRQIFLIFKECVNNIVRHSGARHARILLNGSDNQLALVVEDDGKGFDLRKVSEGNGLRNIRHRARLLHGRLEAHSTPGRGTVLTLRVPLLPDVRDWRHFAMRTYKRAAGE
jgi:signal transduction histidine kinase